MILLFRVVLICRDVRCLQKQCIDFAINARPACRYMPKNRLSFKYRIWKLVISQPFDWFIMCMIALNTLILMMKVRLPALLVTVVTFCPVLMYPHQLPLGYAKLHAMGLIDSVLYCTAKSFKDFFTSFCCIVFRFLFVFFCGSGLPLSFFYFLILSVILCHLCPYKPLMAAFP